VLVSGTSLYNELMRSCLPRMFDTGVDSDLEARPSHKYLNISGQDLLHSARIHLVLLNDRRQSFSSVCSTQLSCHHPRLLAGLAILLSVACRVKDYKFARGCLSAKVGCWSWVQEPLLPAAPTDSGVGMAAPQQGAARQIRGMAKPRSIAGSMYTLARSIRIFPTALSPHRRAYSHMHLPL